MKRYACSITLLLTLCLTLSGHTQTEGVSRQVSALRAAMESFANDAKARIVGLEERENLRTACNNQGRIYWPSHPDANGSGCVTHDDISTGSGEFCDPATVSWRGASPFHPPCTIHSGLTREGYSWTANIPRPPRNCSETPTSYGSATITCTNGEYVVTNSSCNTVSNSCR